MTLLSKALLLCPLNELGIEPKQKKPQGWKNVFTPLAGLAVWVYGAVLASDQWDKLLESGQLRPMAQKGKSCLFKKRLGLSRLVPPSHQRTQKCSGKWGKSLFFFLQDLLERARLGGKELMEKVEGAGRLLGGGERPSHLHRLQMLTSH